MVRAGALLVGAVLAARQCGATTNNNVVEGGDHIKVDIASLDVAGTRALLETWNLDNAFGAEFAALGVDGQLLSAYEPGDLRADAFPNAHKLHWKVLHAKLDEVQNRHRQLNSGAAATGGDDKSIRRRTLKASSGNFSGLQIMTNNSMVMLGEASDVGFKRTGAGVLEVIGKMLLRASEDDDEAINIAATLASLLNTAAGDAPPDNVCLTSCSDIIDR